MEEGRLWNGVGMQLVEPLGPGLECHVDGPAVGPQ